ncbi:MAG TPA: LPS export ABC transporter permease LptG [Caulobacteraceae bacterium]|jgi:lipopolysaccharide export system permease protein
MLSRIERYVLTRTLFAVGGALAVIASIIILIDVVELSRTLGVRAEVSFFQVFGLTLLRSPALILQLLPFAFLFGVLAAFVNLNRRSELIAMRAAGVSAWRFIFPAAGAAAVVGVLTVTALNPLATMLAGQFENVRESLMDNYLEEKDQQIWLRQGDDQTQVVINAKGRDATGTRLRDVSLFVQTVTPEGGLRFQRRIEAAEAVLADGEWRLKDAREAGPGAAAVRYDTLAIPTTLEASAALTPSRTASTVPFWRLPGVISETEAAGFSATAYRLRLHQLLVSPLMYAAMSILAAGFSLRLMRLGGLAALAGAGVALGFVFYFLDQICSAMGRADILPAFAAAWTPPLLALLSGFTLLCYTEDG